MDVPSEVVLRPHHIARVAHFFNMADTLRALVARDPRYGPETADRAAAFYQVLFDNPDTVIVVKEEPDAICKLCGNYDGERCTLWSEKQLSGLDEYETSNYGLREDRYRVRDVKDLTASLFGKHI